VQIYGLPTYATRDQDLRELLQNMFPDCTVLASNLVMKLDQLDGLKSKWTTLTGRIAYWSEPARAAFNEDKVRQARAKLAAVETKILEHACRRPMCTGYGFVTMSSPAGQYMLRRGFSRRLKREHVKGDLMRSHHLGQTLRVTKHGVLKRKIATVAPIAPASFDGSLDGGGAGRQLARPMTKAAEERELRGARQQALSYHLRAREWSVLSAPESGDIIWSNMKVRPKATHCRVCVVNSVVCMFLIFFTTPITMLSGLLAASEPADTAKIQGHTDKAREFLYDAATFGEEWPWILRKWVRDFAPSFTLLCGTLTVLSALEFFTSLERHNLKSQVQRAIAWKTFLFLIISIFLLPSILLDSFDAALHMFFSGSEDIFSVLGRVHGEGNGSFYTCIVLQSTGVVPLQLHRLHEILIGRLATLTSVTPEEKKKGRRPWPHEYGYHYGYMMLVFTIALVFSADSPLIVPCGTVYFLIKHFVDKYNMMHVRPHEYANTNTFTRTGGRSQLCLCCALITECSACRVSLTLH
jgi:hypothetical protein